MDKRTILTNRLERQQNIHNKGFSMYDKKNFLNYADVSLGKGAASRKISNASVNLETAINKVEETFTDKEIIIRAIQDNDLEALRSISNFYFGVSGIYKRACEYLAFLYRYDFYIIPHIKGDKKIKEEKILKDFDNVLSFVENSNMKKFYNDKALEVIKNGCYYGYRIPNKDKVIVQDLPVDYCRSKYFIGNKPAVEFNMKFFDDNFREEEYRDKILSIFPKEFGKGYRMYKEGKLPAETSGDSAGWYLLDPNYTVKFNVNSTDTPYLINAIPALIDLDEAQEIDKKRMLQQIMKIFIQKLPIDKNGELIFDIDEAKDLHVNAVDMLKKVVGADVITTFADIEVKDMDNTTSLTSKADSLSKSERGVFNAMGLSKNIFNTEGNTALDKSILDDEASLKSLIFQYQDFGTESLQDFNTNKNYEFKMKMLETTTYNYKDMSKLYKEQVQLGYSKLLPQLALGHSQKEILSELKFENQILDLASIMVPAQSSSTMSSKDLDKIKQTNQNNNQKPIDDEKSAGRKELPDDQKSDKTLANREALG